MKTILEYVKKYKIPNHCNFTLEEFCDINNINENKLTDTDIEYFYNHYNHYPKFSIRYDIWLNRLEENLKTHSSKQLINKIKKELNKEIIDVIEYTQNNINDNIIIFVKYLNKFVFYDQQEKNILKNTKESEELYNILSFFNYYITLIELDKDKNIWKIYIEPLYTENKTNQIKQNGGKIYHITTKENLEKIQKTGIRPKVGKSPIENSYRYFPNKIFLIGNEKTIKETKQDILEIINDKQLINNYYIIEIDISNINIELWKDNVSYSNNAVYTFNSIPPYLITNIFTDINKN